MKTKTLILILTIICLLTINGCINNGENDVNTDNNVIDENRQIDVNLVDDSNKIIEPKVRIELDKEKYEQNEKEIIIINETPIIPIYVFLNLESISFFVYQMTTDNNEKKWEQLGLNYDNPFTCEDNNVLHYVTYTSLIPECAKITDQFKSVWNQKHYVREFKKCAEENYFTEEINIAKSGIYKIKVCYFTDENYCDGYYQFEDITNLTCLEKEFEIT